jgi:hypothetical protein
MQYTPRWLRLLHLPAYPYPGLSLKSKISIAILLALTMAGFSPKNDVEKANQTTADFSRIQITLGFQFGG